MRGGSLSPRSPFGVGSHPDGETTVGFAAMVHASPVRASHRGLILPWAAPALLAGPRRWQQTVLGCPVSVFHLDLSNPAATPRRFGFRQPDLGELCGSERWLVTRCSPWLGNELMGKEMHPSFHPPASGRKGAVNFHRRLTASRYWMPGQSTSSIHPHLTTVFSPGLFSAAGFLKNAVLEEKNPCPP